MNKKYFEYPFVLLTRGIGEGEQPGSEVGSAHGTTDPCSWAFWYANFGVDFTGDGNITFADYQEWWRQNGFSLADWLACGNEESTYPAPSNP